MPKLSHGNGNGETSSSSKLDRKTIEKNRRIHMKSLCSKLFNLLPPSHFKIPKELISQQNQICYVIAYINELKERVENLEKRKQALQLQTHASHIHDEANNNKRKQALQLQTHISHIHDEANNNDVTLPLIEINDLGNDIVHLMLISSLNRSFMLHQIISIIEEEGGQVVNASLSTIGNKVFHSLHIEAKISRVGIETSRVKQRLGNLVYQKQN